MWMRFALEAEGRRAYGALAEQSKDILATFAEDADFEEAGRWTRDVWTADTTGSPATSACCRVPRIGKGFPLANCHAGRLWRDEPDRGAS